MNYMLKEECKTAIQKEKPKDILCWGKNVIFDLLKDFPERCIKVMVSDNLDRRVKEQLDPLAQKKDIKLESVTSDYLEKICPGENHQGLVAYARPLTLSSLEELFERKLTGTETSLIVMLDHLQDPHNVGAIIRTAEVAGADAIILPRDRSATVNGTVIKVSSGAALKIPVLSVVNLNRTMEKLKERGYWSVGLDHNSKDSMWDTEMPEKTVIILGSEGDGLSRLLRENCDFHCSIPMRGTTGSLNASVACGLGIYEWLRRHYESR